MKTSIQLLVIGLIFSFLPQLLGAQSHNYCQHWKSKLNVLTEEKTSSGPENGFDVLHFDIQVDLTEMTSQILSGVCRLDILTETDLTELELDLEMLEISSVKVDGVEAAFTQNSPKFTVDLGGMVAAETNLSVEVTYSGTPNTASFGGFYFQQGYAYNLGVGIGVDPPNYGRAWFPCVDNFTDRSTYEITVLCQEVNRAYCGGVRISEEVENGIRRTTYDLNEAIPTYLASVAVAPYTEITWTHDGLEGPIPVVLAAVAGDTASMNSAFVNFDTAITAFEEAFGPYRWDRIGFTMVPFGGGAMEHATNIAYPRFAISGGNLTWEGLMAHEFAHHWFGDLATCRTADDMWLNEGWASWCEYFFYEAVYGRDRYEDELRATQFRMLNYVHLLDNGNHPVADVPFEDTYGNTVYSKGALVAHSLRGYMGDEKFFSCIKDYMEEYKFTDVSTENFRDYLMYCSELNLTDFFDGWALQSGFPHFSLDSMASTFDGKVKLYVTQDIVRGEDIPGLIPVDVSFFNAQMEREDRQIFLTGACTDFEIDLGYVPQMAVLDLGEKLADATMTNDRLFTPADLGVHNFEHTNVEINLENTSDDIFFFVENHMVPADRIETSPAGTNLIISEKHFWRINIAQMPNASFDATARFRYNGSNNTNTGLQDEDLFTQSENNLYLMYRPGSGHPWNKFPLYDISTGPIPSDGVGHIETEYLLAGEYALAINDPNRVEVLVDAPPCNVFTGVEETNGVRQLSIFPNPGSGIFQLDLPTGNWENSHVVVTDITGKNSQVVSVSKNNQLDLSGFSAGIYLLEIDNGQIRFQGKLVVVE